MASEKSNDFENFLYLLKKQVSLDIPYTNTL